MMEYYSAIKRNKQCHYPFFLSLGSCPATWMDLEIIIISEASQPEKDRYHMISLICGI